MATIIENDTRQSDVRTTADTGRRRSSKFVLVVAFVLVGLLGFGLGWLAFRDTGTDVPDDIEQLVEDWGAAWNAGDGDAVVALMTPGGRHYFAGRAEGMMGDELVAMIDGFGATDAFDVNEYEAFVGDDPYILIMSGTVSSTEGYSVYEITEFDGEMKIRVHYWMT
jgi:hypothetical protein